MEKKKNAYFEHDLIPNISKLYVGKQCDFYIAKLALSQAKRPDALCKS